MKELKELLVSLNERVDKLEYEIHILNTKIDASMRKLENDKWGMEKDIAYLQDDIRKVALQVGHTHYREF